jgi:uncharacterized peroxidase-related enzyme
MAFIDLSSDEDAPEGAADLLEGDRAALGYVPAYARLFARRPAVYAAWRALNGAIKETLDLRLYELATLAAARELRSSYCSLAHGKILAERFFDADVVRALALDHTSAGLAQLEVAVMDLAAKVVRDATAVTQQDVDRLRELGLDDDEVLGVVLTAAARCFFSKTLDALGAQPDPAYRALEPALRDALTVGRPIADD